MTERERERDSDSETESESEKEMRWLPATTSNHPRVLCHIGPTAAEREGNDFKGYQDFCLK